MSFAKPFRSRYQRIGSHDAEIDALQEQNVGDALHRPAPDDREYAQLVAVVEHGGEIGTDLHIGAAIVPEISVTVFWFRACLVAAEPETGK